MPIKSIYVDKAAAQKRVKIIVLNRCMAKTQKQVKEENSNFFKKHHIFVFSFFLIMGVVLKVISGKSAVFASIFYIVSWYLFNKYYPGGPEKHYEFLKLFISIFILGIISNQAIQPLFTPRISEISVTPMYIANYNTTEYASYGLMSKVSYNIDVPLIPLLGRRTISLKLPESTQNSKFRLLTGFKENNPYITYPDGYDIPKSEILVKITTDAWHLRSLKLNLYVSEEIKLEVIGDGYPVPSLSSDITTAPTITRDVLYQDYELAYVSRSDNSQYLLKIHLIQNRAELEIRGFKDYLDEGTIRVCDNDLELGSTSEYENWFGNKIDHVLVYLNPLETKRLIIIQKVNRTRLRDDRATYDLKSNYECSEISKLV